MSATLHLRDIPLLAPLPLNRFLRCALIALLLLTRFCSSPRSVFRFFPFRSHALSTGGAMEDFEGSASNSNLSCCDTTGTEKVVFSRPTMHYNTHFNGQVKKFYGSNAPKPYSGYMGAAELLPSPILQSSLGNIWLRLWEYSLMKMMCRVGRFLQQKRNHLYFFQNELFNAAKQNEHCRF